MAATRPGVVGGGWRPGGTLADVRASAQREIERFGHGGVADLAARDVEAVGEMRIGGHRGFGAALAQMRQKPLAGSLRLG